MKSPIPDAVLAQHTIALGKTRSGKSSALRYLVEKQLDAGRRVCILDPKGDWHGLRVSADGKKPGYPVVIFGGEHADVPLNQHAGAHVAELIATGNRPSLIDLGGWHVGERTRFFIDFAATLFRTVKAPLLLVIDECHNFVPQGKILDPDAGKMLHWANRLASEGGGKGMILLAASQRPQKVHKDFVTSMETLMAFRVIHVLDRQAMKDWIDGAPDREKGREVLESLATMPRGEAWVWSPEIGFGPQRVKFPRFTTFDSFAAPTGDAAVPLKGWAEVDLDDVRAKLASVVQEAEANDPKKLRARIAELERAALTKRPPAESHVDIDAEVNRAVAERDRHWAAEIRKLEASIAGHRDKLGQINRISTLNGEAQVASVPPPIRPAARPPRVEPEIRWATAPIATRKAADAGGSLGAGERKVLKAIAQCEPGATRKQITQLTAYKKSSRDTYISRLCTAGQVAVINDGLIQATPAGIAALGDDFERLPVGDALLKHWLVRLPEGEASILRAVAAGYPNAVDRQLITDQTGYKKSSRDTYLSRLAARQLVTTQRDGVRAADVLFD